VIEQRWEHGSDFHWSAPVGTGLYPWRDRGMLFGTGRFALVAVLQHIGCKRLWVPSFYCPDVIAAIPADVTVAVYRDSPEAVAETLADLPIEEGDAVLVQNLYGLRARPPVVPADAVLIEDHSHDLTSAWAEHSSADYCISSLRKQLPVADGGVAWSPSRRSLPAEPDLHASHESAASERLTGMLLKSAYLDGGAVAKDAYRGHLVVGERALAHGPLSTLLPVTRASLPAFPLAQWRAARAANFAAFSAALGQLAGTMLFAPIGSAVPFTATLCFDSAAMRESVRARLIDSRIYPAILWSLVDAKHPVHDDEIELSRRVLSIHCDHRYTPADMERVADAVRRSM
jgi:hypothetical protein